MRKGCVYSTLTDTWLLYTIPHDHTHMDVVKGVYLVRGLRSYEPGLPVRTIPGTRQTSQSVPFPCGE